MNTSLGLDMSMAEFSACLRIDAKRHLKASFANTRAGFRRLACWYKSHGVTRVRVGLECTNTFGQAIAQWLHENGQEVYLINPERSHAYAQCRGQRNKTDATDAQLIADFVAVHEDLTRWSPPAPEQLALSALTRARAALVSQRQQLANQLRTAHQVVQPFLKNALKSLNHQITAIEQKLRTLLREHAALNERVQRVMTIKGVGWLTAVTVIAELPNIDSHTDARAICAWAGLIPRRWQSGKKELPSRLSKRGNYYLRRALFMPSLTAKRYNPLFQSFALRLAQKGKRPGAILGAISHKLLRIIVGLLKSNSDFDPAWSFSKS